MSKPFLKIKCSENRVEKVRQLTQIFCILDFQDITPRELDLLCEIIYHNGVNDKSKKSFILTYKTSSANHGQLVKRLSDKGILVDKQARTGKVLHSSFNDLKKYYVDVTEPNVLAIVVP